MNDPRKSSGKRTTERAETLEDWDREGNVTEEPIDVTDGRDDE